MSLSDLKDWVPWAIIGLLIVFGGLGFLLGKLDQAGFLAIFSAVMGFISGLNWNWLKTKAFGRIEGYIEPTNAQLLNLTRLLLILALVWPILGLSLPFITLEILYLVAIITYVAIATVLILSLFKNMQRTEAITAEKIAKEILRKTKKISTSD